MRKSLALAVATASALGAGVLAPTAASANSGTTALTGTVGISGAGVVAIVTQPTAVLTQSGNNLTGSLGVTTVTDTQLGSHNWAVTIRSTDLTMVGATSSIPTIAATAASVSMAAPAVAVPGTATITSYPSSPLTLSNTDQNLVQASATNANVVTYSPSVSVAIPGGQTAGAYAATVTQTVS